MSVINFSLEGKVAIVTGGSRGIGRSIAIGLAESGADVAIAARKPESLEEAVGAVQATGRRGLGIPTNVRELDSLQALVDQTKAKFGRVDILINNAATATSNRLGRITMAEWEHIMAVNATGTFLSTQAMFDGMVERGWGRVVNVSSLAGLQGDRYIAAYVAAEHAVIGFTKAVAAEAEDTGVTVNAVCPGYVDTPLTDETVARIMHLTGKSWQEALRSVLDKAGQSRLIRAGEVAESILKLCADERGKRNGEVVILDGSDTP